MFWAIEQTPWGGKGKSKSQSSWEDFEESHSFARMLCLTKQALIQHGCPQRCLDCKPILKQLSAGKGIIWQGLSNERDVEQMNIQQEDSLGGAIIGLQAQETYLGSSPFHCSELVITILSSHSLLHSNTCMQMTVKLLVFLVQKCWFCCCFSFLSWFVVLQKEKKCNFNVFKNIGFSFFLYCFSQSPACKEDVLPARPAAVQASSPSATCSKQSHAGTSTSHPAVAETDTATAQKKRNRRSFLHQNQQPRNAHHQPRHYKLLFLCQTWKNSKPEPEWMASQAKVASAYESDGRGTKSGTCHGNFTFSLLVW